MTPTEIRRRACVRACIYTAVLGLIVLATSAALYLRTPLKLDVIRDRGSMGREVEDGMIENVYRLQIMNTSEQAHVYKIAVSGIDMAQVTADRRSRPPRPRAIRCACAPRTAPASRARTRLSQPTAVDDPSLHEGIRGLHVPR
jgi:polyferredoxin